MSGPVVSVGCRPIGLADFVIAALVTVLKFGYVKHAISAPALSRSLISVSHFGPGRAVYQPGIVEKLLFRLFETQSIISGLSHCGISGRPTEIRSVAGAAPQRHSTT
jgi:hypothetical protein